MQEEEASTSRVSRRIGSTTAVARFVVIVAWM